MGENGQSSTCYRCGEELRDAKAKCANCDSFQNGSIDFVGPDEVRTNEPSVDAPKSPGLSFQTADNTPIEIPALSDGGDYSLASENEPEPAVMKPESSEPNDLDTIQCPRCEHETTLDDEHCDNCLYYINDLLEHDEHYKPPEKKEQHFPFGNHHRSTAQTNLENLLIVGCFLLLFLGIGFYATPTDAKMDVEDKESSTPPAVQETSVKESEQPVENLSEVFKAIAMAKSQTQPKAPPVIPPENDSFSWGEVDNSRELALEALYEAGHITESDYELLKNRMLETRENLSSQFSEELADETQKPQSHALWQCDKNENSTPHYTSNPTRSDESSCSPKSLSNATYNKYRSWHRGWKR